MYVERVMNVTNVLYFVSVMIKTRELFGKENLRNQYCYAILNCTLCDSTCVDLSLINQTYIDLSISKLLARS